MIRKAQLLFLLVLITITLIKADPYKPKPILFIHGVGSNSRAWDAPTKEKHININGHLRKHYYTDSLLKDSIIADSIQLSNLLQDTVSATGDYLNGLLNLKKYGTGTYVHFWHKMEPIVNEWWRYQKNNSFPITFTVDSSSSWPNKTFLEVISFDDPWGSVDPHGGWPDRYNTPGNFTGTGDELRHRIREVLGEYYGNGPNDTTGLGTWVSDTSAKVILIAHSMGNQAVQEALKQDTILAYHLYKYITVDGVVNGTVLATPNTGDILITGLANYPLLLLIKPALSIIMHAIPVETIMKKIDNNYDSNMPQSGIERIFFSTYSNILMQFDLSSLLTFAISVPGAFTLLRWNANQQLPTLRDLAQNSACVNSHKGEVAKRIANAGGKFVSIRGIHPLNDMSFNFIGKHNIGDILFAAGAATVESYALAPYLWPLAIIGGESMLTWWWYDTNSDFLVDKWGQDLNSVYSGYNARVIDVCPKMHTNAPHNYDTLFKAIEEPPVVYIDSVAIKRDSMSDTIVALHQDRIDTLPGKPSKIYGRIYDYFLAQTENRYFLNGYRDFGDIINFGKDTTRHTELGLNGNSFVVDSINPLWVFNGINKITVKCKNIEGQGEQTIC